MTLQELILEAQNTEITPEMIEALNARLKAWEEACREMYRGLE